MVWEQQLFMAGISLKIEIWLLYDFEIKVALSFGYDLWKFSCIIIWVWMNRGNLKNIWLVFEIIEFDANSNMFGFFFFSQIQAQVILTKVREL